MLGPLDPHRHHTEIVRDVDQFDPSVPELARRPRVLRTRRSGVPRRSCLVRGIGRDIPLSVGYAIRRPESGLRSDERLQ